MRSGGNCPVKIMCIPGRWFDLDVRSSWTGSTNIYVNLWCYFYKVPSSPGDDQAVPVSIASVYHSANTNCMPLTSCPVQPNCATDFELLMDHRP